MKVSELYDLFRSDVDDQAKPYLWSDVEVYLYMDDAYRMFVRKTGGIPDSTSALTRVQVVAGQSYALVSPLILKFRIATLVSNNDDLVIINPEDVNKISREDYGYSSPINPNTPGRITHMVIGSDRTKEGGQVRWIQKPIVADSVQMTIMRLPQDRITGVSSDDFEFDEIGEEHHQHLLIWMKARAYGKQDAETFDKNKAEALEARFDTYCEMATSENDRFKSKVRVTGYGGL